MKKDEELSKRAGEGMASENPKEWKILANELYAIYPRRQNPIPAEKAVIRAIEREGDFETFKVMAKEAVAKFAKTTETWTKADMRYIPTMATFFDNGSYRDDPSTWERNGGRSHGSYDFSGMKPVTQEDLEEVKNEVF